MSGYRTSNVEYDLSPTWRDPAGDTVCTAQKSGRKGGHVRLIATSEERAVRQKEVLRLAARLVTIRIRQFRFLGG